MSDEFASALHFSVALPPLADLNPETAASGIERTTQNMKTQRQRTSPKVPDRYTLRLRPGLAARLAVLGRFERRHVAERLRALLSEALHEWEQTTPPPRVSAKAEGKKLKLTVRV